MSVKTRILLMSLMLAALFFGFVNVFFPGESVLKFERLHIFLFNLASGGTILIYFSESKKSLSYKGISFLGLASAYSVFAFLEIYLPAVAIAFLMAGIVEFTRIKKFSLFPWDFFNARTPVSRKFHHAALLCLSTALLFSGLAILNNYFWNVIVLEKLKIDAFFLGFSFPLSLMTMSIIFLSMEPASLSNPVITLHNAGFWSINLGVILFFILILFEKLIPQLIITIILFLSVLMICFLYMKFGARTQQKIFFASCILFLLYTAVTGIIYVVCEFSPYRTGEKIYFLLKMHSFASLYGWNLCGLALICRKNDFPIKMHSKSVIALHWLTSIILAPLGAYYIVFAVPAFICYALILTAILFSPGLKNGSLEANLKLSAIKAGKLHAERSSPLRSGPQ